MSPRSPKQSPRVRPFPQADDEPEVVRAPPEPEAEEPSPPLRRQGRGRVQGGQPLRPAGRPAARRGVRPASGRPAPEVPGRVAPVEEGEEEVPRSRRRPLMEVVAPEEELPAVDGKEVPAAKGRQQGAPPREATKPPANEADGKGAAGGALKAAGEETEAAQPASDASPLLEEESTAGEQQEPALELAPEPLLGEGQSPDGQLEEEQTIAVEQPAEGVEDVVRSLAELTAAAAEEVAPEQLVGLVEPGERAGHARPLPEVLQELGFVSAQRVEQAVLEGKERGVAPERLLLEQGVISEDQLARALAERYGHFYIDLSTFQVDPAAVSLISNQAAKRYQAVPVAFLDGGETVVVAMADPANILAVDDIQIMVGREVRVAVATPQDVGDLIARMDRLEPVVEEGEEAEAEVVEVRETAEDAPVVKLVNQLVAQAVELGASDLHLAPGQRDLRIRFRIDGVLRDITTIPRRLAGGVISRIKIMAELDIAERRLPQDGRVGLNVDGRHVDLRVVTLPSAKGEAVVMRILDKEAVVMDLGRLGMAADDRARFERAFHLSHGAVLVTGPTGSGKTTTLYAALTKLNTKERNIITIEDPVEYQLDGVTQVQVQPKVGLTFAVGLRTMVRADPDVIMVGEIRDRETAQIAVESALTGHLVLSTLHTNDAPSAIHRLIEMGIEPFLVSSAVECVLAQRLARTLCSHCKRKAVVNAEVLRANGFEASRGIETYEPVGCPRCGHTGYRGRTAIYEVMAMSRELRELALARRSADEIRDVAIAQGMRRMRDDGLEKVRRGITSLPEVLRVIGSTT